MHKNKPAALSLYDILLPSGIKGLTGFYKGIEFAVRTCIDFNLCVSMCLDTLFLNGFPLINFYFVPLGKGLFVDIYYGFTFDTNRTHLKHSIGSCSNRKDLLIILIKI